MKINPTRAIILAIVLVLGSSASLSTVFAAEGKKALADKATTTQEKASAQDNAEQQIDGLEEILVKIEERKKGIEELQRRISKSEGLIKKALDVRLSKARISLLEAGLSFAEGVLAEEKAGNKVENYRKQAIEILSSQAAVASTAAQGIRARIEEPKPGLTAAEQAAAYTKIFSLLNSLNDVYALFINSA